MFHAFDASVPPADAYPGCQAVCGYIGGPTPHVWTLDEWLRFAHLKQAPIWLYDGSASAALQGRAAVAGALRRGWAVRDARRVIFLDMELAENPAWISEFAAAVHEGGFVAADYRSLSSLEAGGDPGVLGSWIAAWDGVASVEPVQHVIGHQYAADIAYQGTEVDLSVFDGSVLDHFGHGPRHLA